MLQPGPHPPRIPSVEEIEYHVRSYEGYPGCPPYDGKHEWTGLLRNLAQDGLEWCQEE